jgi:hypothetical protein
MSKALKYINPKFRDSSRLLRKRKAPNEAALRFARPAMRRIMEFYNMPAGCFGPSDLDHYAALGIYEPGCEKHRQEYDLNGRCDQCDDEAKAEELEYFLDECPSQELLSYWQDRSELFKGDQ